jgi:ribonucleoside-diphosphate reductase alpha chain
VGDPGVGPEVVPVGGGGGAAPGVGARKGEGRGGEGGYDPSRHFGSDLAYKVFLDRYTRKDIERRFRVGDVALALVVDDPQWPRKEVARVLRVEGDELELEVVTGPEKGERIRRERSACDRPVETTPEAVWRRVADALAEVEREEVRPLWRERFYEALSGWKFVPGGRILAGAGMGNLTLYNCYVVPSPRDSRQGIIETLGQMIEIMSRGGGVGINVSSLRPRRAVVRGVNGRSSGAVSWMDLYSRATGLVEQGGSRRGALMLMLHDWHPDLLRFIDAKRTPGMVENANISVCVSDAFMQAVKRDEMWELRFPDTDDPDYNTLWTGDLEAWERAGKPTITYDRRPAREIWQRLIESAWASAEPGIAFLERSNKQSNSWYFHPLIATNPCVTGDTLIFTGQGLRRADELFLSHAPVEAVVDGRMKAGRTAAASPVFLTGLKPVVRVLTREGYSVRVTPDHRIYSDERGWVPAAELRRGEAVRILDHPGGFGTGGSEDLGRVLGYMSVAARRRGDTLRLAFAPERQAELEPLLAACVRRLGGMGEDAAGAGGPPRRGRSAAMVGHQLGEIAFAHGLGVGAPAVPDAVSRGSEAMQRGYLQAVFEAGGYLSQARGRPVLTARAPAGLLRGVQQLLLNMGIASRLRTARGHELDDNLPALLTLEREGLLRFCAVVGALSPSRRGALADAAAELRRHPLAPERYVAHVERVVEDGMEAVYDLTEPETHSFVAGGLVVHNCAEQPLPAWGVCCLGHVNLSRFVADGEVDWDGLSRTVRAAVRFLDNVVDATPYYFEENAATQKGERRLGLGTMGLGEVLIRLGMRYGSPESVRFIDRLYAFIAHEAYAASCDLAEEKGAFPLFDAERFLESGFMQGMPEDIRERVRTHGIRNVTLLTQAPTGTVGTMVGTSTGIEPFYALKYLRQSRLGVDEQYVAVAEEWMRDHPGQPLPPYFVGAMDLTPDEHIRVQAAVQRWTDSSISKTANAPADYTVEDTRRLYELAYDLGCKGVTIYRDQSRHAQVLHRADQGDEAAAASAPAPAAKAAADDGGPSLARRPRRMRGECFLVPTHFGNLTLDVHEDPATGEPVEIIASAGTAGSDLMADAVALGMAASVLLRLKGPVPKRERLEILIEKFRNIGGAKNGPVALGAAASLAQGIARGLEQYLESLDGATSPPAATAGAPAPALSQGRQADFDLCPACGTYSMEMVEGCRTCHACGFSNCS